MCCLPSPAAESQWRQGFSGLRNAVSDREAIGQRGQQVWVAAAEAVGQVSLRYGQSTHSSVPSAKNWCFQIGT